MSDTTENETEKLRALFRASIAFEKAKQVADLRKQQEAAEKKSRAKPRLVLTRGD